MKIWGLNRILLITSILALSACSTENRMADPQISSEELISIFTEISGNSGDSVVSSLASDPSTLGLGNSTIFYHARGDVSRPSASVLSVDDITLFDTVTWNDHVSQLGRARSSAEIIMDQVDVIFVDTVNSTGERFFSLMIRMQYQSTGTVDYVASSGANEFSFNDTTFQTVVHGPTGDLILESDDLSKKYGDELGDSVKLNIYKDLGNGQYGYVGQISTMAGFGNR